MTGADVLRIRTAAGLKKSALAQLLGKHGRSVHRWEDCGDADAPIDGTSRMVLEMLEAGELPERYLEAVRG